MSRSREGALTLTRRLVVVAAVVLAVAFAGAVTSACRTRAARLERPARMAATPWTEEATGVARSLCASAALLDDPGPTPASWPTTSGAEWIGRYRGRIVTDVRTAQKVVALTFDDGPDGSTRDVVDILERYDAHATFFFRGEALPRFEIDYAVAHGNEIGNHTASHVGLSQQSPVALASQIDPVDDEVFWVVGRRPLWVRARAGSVSPRALEQIATRGQLYANWSVSANDTDWSVPAPRIADNVVRHVRPGSIVLLHQTRPDTVVALPTILAELKARGYRFLTLSELAALGES